MTLPAYPIWYVEWLTDHLVKFGVKTADNMAMVTSWWPEFSAIDATEFELRAATSELLSRSESLRKISDHFGAIKESVLGSRRFLQTRQDMLARDRDTQSLADIRKQVPGGILAEYLRRTGQKVNSKLAKVA